MSELSLREEGEEGEDSELETMMDDFPSNPSDDDLRQLYAKARAQVRFHRSKRRRTSNALQEYIDGVTELQQKLTSHINGGGAVSATAMTVAPSLSSSPHSSLATTMNTVFALADGTPQAPPTTTTTTTLTDSQAASAKAKATQFLNDLELKVIDWTDDPAFQKPTNADVKSGAKPQLFPHRVRCDASGNLQAYVETTREVRIYAYVYSKTTKAVFTDDKAILRHANELLPETATHKTALSFECFIVHSGLDNEDTMRPIAHGPNNQFSMEIASVDQHGRKETCLFMDQEGSLTKNSKIAEADAGVLRAESIKLKREVLTSNLLTSGRFRFCFKPMHPELAKFQSLTGRSQAFSTSARVRSLAA